MRAARLRSLSPADLRLNVTKALNAKQDRFPQVWPQGDGQAKSIRRKLRYCNVVFRSVVPHEHGRMASARISPEWSRMLCWSAMFLPAKGIRAQSPAPRCPDFVSQCVRYSAFWMLTALLLPRSCSIS